MIIGFDEDKNLKRMLRQHFKDNIIEYLTDWHKKRNFKFESNLRYIIEELKSHTELKPEKKLELLTNKEYLATSEIRKNGILTVPDEWFNPKTLQVDYNNLDEIWLRPSKGYLYRILDDSKDIRSLNKLQNSKGFKRRGLNLNIEDRKKQRLLKLQKSILRFFL